MAAQMFKSFIIGLLRASGHEVQVTTRDYSQTLALLRMHHIEATVMGRHGGRAIVARRMQPLPVEAVVRGYLEGSGWKEYRESQSVCGVALPAGLKKCLPCFTRMIVCNRS